MKIYWLRKIKPNEYADFSHIGTWSDQTEYCNRCEYSDQHLIEPLKVEWEPGSDKIGDFSWCGSAIVVNDRVRTFLEKSSFECSFGRVEMNPSTTPSRGRKSVESCSEKKLHWVIPNIIMDVDVERSGLDVEKCPKCRRKDHQFKQHGLVIPRSKWNSENIFGIKPFGKSITYIVEQGLNEILNQHFSNFTYSEAGSII